jgi:hypothetical protein
MYSILIVFLLIGIVLIIDGIYREEIERLKQDRVVEYKYIPRNMYDDVLITNSYKQDYAPIFDDKVDLRSPGRYE